MGFDIKFHRLFRDLKGERTEDPWISGLRSWIPFKPMVKHQGGGDRWV